MKKRFLTILIILVMATIMISCKQKNEDVEKTSLAETVGDEKNDSETVIKERDGSRTMPYVIGDVVTIDCCDKNNKPLKLTVEFKKYEDGILTLAVTNNEYNNGSPYIAIAYKDGDGTDALLRAAYDSTGGINIFEIEQEPAEYYNNETDIVHYAMEDVSIAEGNTKDIRYNIGTLKTVLIKVKLDKDATEYDAKEYGDEPTRYIFLSL